jgi:hypothetical protein
MSVQMSGPLPRSLVVAALTKPQPDGRRARGWMRRRGLRPVAAPEVATGGEVCIDTLTIDTAADFAQCQHPGCCALRPIEGTSDCAVCGRR